MKRKAPTLATQSILPLVTDDMDQVDGETATLLTPEDVARCSGHVLALDCETTGLRWYADQLLGVGIWCPGARVFGYLSGEALEPGLQAMRDWDRSTHVIGHNLKFDLHFMKIDPRLEDERLRWQLHDTAIMSHLIDSRLPKSLDELERRHLGTASKMEYVSLIPKGSERLMRTWPLPILRSYCVNDCRVTFELARLMLPQVRELQLQDLYLQQCYYLAVVWTIETTGMLAEPSFWLQAASDISEESVMLEQSLREQLSMPTLDWRSDKALSHALYDVYGWPRPVNPFLDENGNDTSRMKMKGKYNKTMTSGFLLSEKAQHPLAPLVLALRENDKLHACALSMVDFQQADGLIHPSFNLTGTRTGRLSSSAPNVQNLPGPWRTSAMVSAFQHSGVSGSNAKVSAALGRQDRYNLRKGLISRPGHTMVSIDYKQMEMRMFATLLQDEYMLDSLRSGRDIHADIARMVWGEANKINREWAKVVTFGLIYGMTLGSLQFRMNLTREQAHNVADQYGRTFPKVSQWLKDVVRTCQKQGFLRYWSGRIWREDDPMSMYMGANAMIQGGCADLFSIAVCRSDKILRRMGGGHILNLVHDEIIFELEDDRLQELVPLLQEAMEVPDLLDIAWVGDASTGHDYGSLDTKFTVEASPKEQE